MFDPVIFKLLGYVLIFLLVGPIFPLLYVVLRWRTAGEHEPGSGTYCAVLYFLCASLLLTLVGGANLSYGLFSTTPVDPEMERLSWGLLFGAGAFLALNVLLAVKFVAAPASAPEARRLFGGFLALIAGMVSVYAIVKLFATLATEAKTDRALELRNDELKLYGAWLFYFVALYLITMLRLRPRG